MRYSASPLSAAVHSPSDSLTRPGHDPAADTCAGVSPTYVVIAAYNEGTVIGEVVRELKDRYAHIVVVDDGSGDTTAANAASAGALVVCHVLNRGQGAALQTGIEFALRAGAGFIVTFDADGQHEASDVASLLDPLIRGAADVALGSRFLGSTNGMPRRRRAILWAAIAFTRIVSGIRLTDTHNGLRAFSRRAAERIRLTQDRMAHASEIIDQVAKSGYALVEVPVHVRYTPYSRAKGQGTANSIRIAFDYILGRIVR